MLVVDTLLQRSVIIGLAALGAVLVIVGIYLKNRFSSTRNSSQVNTQSNDDESTDTQLAQNPGRAHPVTRIGYLITWASVALFIIAGFRSAYD